MTWTMARNTQKLGKGEIHTLGPGNVWQETIKSRKIKCTLQDLEYGGKLKIMENEKHTRQVLSWNMVRNAQKRGKREMHTVGPGIS